MQLQFEKVDGGDMNSSHRSLHIAWDMHEIFLRCKSEIYGHKNILYSATINVIFNRLVHELIERGAKLSACQ